MVTPVSSSDSLEPDRAVMRPIRPLATSQSPRKLSVASAKIGTWPIECAMTRSRGSRKGSSTTARRPPQRLTPRSCQRICATPGNVCVRPPSLLGISGSMPLTNRSCSRANPATIFVRPKKSFLELCVFLGRALEAPQVRRIDRASKAKLVHLFHIRHRDEVEAPVTDWLREAYELSDVAASKSLDRPKPKPGPMKTRSKAERETTAATKSQRRRRDGVSQ